MAGLSERTRSRTFLVDTNDLARWRWDDLALDDGPPGAGNIELQVEKFAFSANNITYARLGRAADYWSFYPAPEGSGIVPVWGFATVTRSSHDDIGEGERIYGFLPLARRFVLSPARVAPARFAEGSAHRASLAQAYNDYMRVNQQPLADPAREDLNLVLRPLFALSFFLAETLIERDCHGADLIVISSASSKTALGLAHILTRQQRVASKVVGLTSARHLEFVRGTGCFDAVLPYGDLPVSTIARLVYIDIAGNRDLRYTVHRHYGSALAHSYQVGFTHGYGDNENETLPGPRPEFFFTPDHIVQRKNQWGGRELLQRLMQRSQAFYDNAAGWLRIVTGNGPVAIEAAYARSLAGDVSPTEGHVLRWE